MKSFVSIILAVACFGGGAVHAQTTAPSSKKPNFFSIVQDFRNYETTVPKEDYRNGHVPGWKQFERWKWFWESRVDENGNFPNQSVLMQEWEKSVAFNAKIKGERTLGTTALAQWKQIGPAVIPSNGPGGEGGMGRINCVRPSDKTPSTIWVGTAAGGAWKSTDAGATWSPMTDNLPALSVSDVAIHPNSINTVFIATGDANPGGSFQHYSAGVLRSDDGGKTWNTTGLGFRQSDQYVVKRLLINPNTPNLMLAATNNGVLLTSDGGVSWSSAQSGNFRDMEFQPGNPLVVYAVTNSVVYKSINAGKDWTALSSSGISGTINMEIAVTTANPNYVYIVGARGNRSFAGLWLSTNAGVSWKLQSSSPDILCRNVNGNGGGAQGEYDLAIAAPRTPVGTVVVGGINIWRSINDGINWGIVAHWTGAGGKPYVHADIHDLAYSTNGNLYAGCDGGIFVSQDGGTSWVDLSKGLCISQFYRMAVGATNANMIYGGAQDNGTSRYNGSGWRAVIGGDGMNCIVDYKNANIAYGSIYNGNLYRTGDGGNSWTDFINSGITQENAAWVTPFQLHPTTPNTAFAGFSNVWKTTDAGGSWAKISGFSQGTLRVLEIAESNPDYIYAGNDNGYRYTTDGGKAWKTLTLSISAGAVSSLAIDPKKPNRIWLGISGFGSTKVIESSDFGANWKNVSSGMPAVPVNCIVYQKNSPDRMYAGTDIGVYYRDSLTNLWTAYNDGLPATIVADLDIHYASGKLYAGTFGRGIWSGNLANCNTKIDLAITQKGELTFCDGDSVTLTAQSGYVSYLWSNGATTPSITVKTSGTYSASALNAAGCPATSQEFTVAAMPRSKPNIISSRTKPVLCGGTDSVQLSATVGFSTYRWNTGDTTRRIFVRTPGKYVVAVTKPGNCDGRSDTLELTLATPAPVTISRNGNEMTANPAGTSYEWYFNGAKIDGATGRNYTPTQSNGNITVVVTDANGCRATSAETPVSVDENTAETGDIFVTPNPTSGDITLNITLPAAGLALIELIAADGKVVKRESIRTADTRLETMLTMSDLALGVYYLRVTAGGREWKRSVVKQ